MRRLLAVLPLIAVAACTAGPSIAPVVRPATPVAASFGKTWDAVVDVFAERNLPIRTLDRSSGLIVPNALLIPAGNAAEKQKALSYADCGSTMGVPIPPAVAQFNVVVRGDSSSSTVQVRAFYSYGADKNPLTGADSPSKSCVSRGVLESDIETAIRGKAQTARGQ